MKMYGNDNIKAVKSFYGAASSGDFNAARELLDSNVEWIEPNVSGLWFGGTHHGAEAVFKEVFSPTAEKIDKFHVKMKHYFSVGDQVVALGYFRGHGKVTGKELDVATAHVLKLRQGKIVRFEAFHDIPGWMDTLGMIHPDMQRMAA